MPSLIIKADGSSELFDRNKLLASLERSGASRERAQEVTKIVERSLQDGITTGEIYRHAFAELRHHPFSVAARYSLKRALLDFGPSGFPFEAFLAEVFRAERYEAVIDQIIPGKCVEHEVDVVLTKGEEKTYIEAKFHNTAGFKTNLKTVLYVKARLEDIADKQGLTGMVQGLIVTNTKFTGKAIEYATCAGIGLLGWEYPEKGNLHDRIDSARTYPITALTTLSKKEKVGLLGNKVVLCNDLVANSEALQILGITGKHMDTVISEAAGLCVPGKDI